MYQTAIQNPTITHCLPSFKIKFLKIIFSYLNSSVSVESSCSICKNTCNISLIMIGQSDVTCRGLILNNITRKHKNTCACTLGTLSLKLLVNCSEIYYELFNVLRNFNSIVSHLVCQAYTLHTGQLHYKI